MAIIDYKDRVYDYMAFQNVRASGDALLATELFNTATGGSVCTGAQKLAQRWALEFLTEVGSMPGLPRRGTTFMTAVRLGRLSTYTDVNTNFVFSSYTARLNLQQEEDDTWPDDERLASAELLSVEFAPGYASLSVAIISRAGNTRKVILPINTIPEKIG